MSRAQSSSGMKPLEYNELLGEFRDQPELLIELFLAFIEGTRKDINDLSEALVAHDARRVAGAAHRLKGSAATVGAQPIRMEAERIEALGLRGLLEPASESMTSLCKEYERFCRYVEELKLVKLPEKF